MRFYFVTCIVLLSGSLYPVAKAWADEDKTPTVAESAISGGLLDESLRKVTLQLPWLHQFQFAGYYAAIEKGYYRDAGFEVTPVEGGPGRTPAGEVCSGRAAYGVARGELLFHRIHGEPVVALAVIFQHSAIIILAKEESGIEHPQDLIGRRLMIAEGNDAAEYIAMFRNEGVALEQIDLIPTSYDIDDLVEGKTDAFNAYSTNEPYYLEQKGIPCSIIRPVSYGIDFYGDCLFTSEEEIEEHPSDVKAFRAASLKGWAHALENPDEIVDLILENYGPVKSREHLLFEAASIQELVLPKLVEIGHMNPGRWKHMADTYVRLGMAPADYSLEGFIYQPDKPYSREWVRRIGFFALAAILLTVVGSIILAVFNARLRVLIGIRTKELSDANEALVHENTERRKTEEALLESEQLLNQAQCTAHVGSYSRDIGSGEIVWSDEQYRLFGYEPGEIAPTFEFVLEHVHPEDQAAFVEANEALLTKNVPYNQVYRIVRKDGAVRTLHSASVLERDASGKAVRQVGAAQDITEGTRAEEELASAKSFLDTVVDMSPFAMWVSDAAGTIIRTNRSLRETLNLTDEQLVGKYNVLADENLIVQGRMATVKDVFEKNAAARFSLPWTVANAGDVDFEGGRDLYVYLAMFPILNRGGQLTNVVCQWVDITERKRAEEALRQSENRFRAAFDTAQDCVLIWDKDYNYLYANQAAIDHVGTSPDKVIGKSIRDGLGHIPDFMHRWMGRVDKVFATGERLRVQDEQEMQGHLYHTDSILSPILDADGNVVSVCVVYRDVTELKQAAERIGLLAEIVDAAPNCIVVHEHDGGILYANQRTFEMYGYEEAEFMAINLRDINAAESKKLFAPRMKEIDKLGEVSVEATHVRKEGSTFSLLIHAKKTHWKGTPAILSIGTDITEHKRIEAERRALERQVQHAQKLESLGVLAGGIAHDFNNLLMAILGNADLALDELSPHAPARDNIQEIEKASKRAAELAKQMLAYSGKGRFVIETINLNEFVEEMAHLLEVSTSKKAVLKYNFAHDVPAFEGDPTQIRQIIMNLITNASEAIGDTSGVVALSTGAMDCDRAYLDGICDTLRATLDAPLPEGAYTYLEVADTGCGMTAETLEKVFDPFFTTKFTGRGLGMAAVLGIVRGHQGALKVYSELGKGTTFKILFPAKDQPEAPSPIRTKGKSAAKPWRGTGLVLIADDEQTVRAVGKRMLERMGFSVLTANDGREALALFRDRSAEIVCVLLDLTMPHMDGEEAFREMRRIHPSVKVILCSGYNEQDATQRFAGKGLAGFLQKPYHMAALTTKLTELLKDTASPEEDPDTL